MPTGKLVSSSDTFSSGGPAPPFHNIIVIYSLQLNAILSERGLGGCCNPDPLFSSTTLVSSSRVWEGGRGFSGDSSIGSSTTVPYPTTMHDRGAEPKFSSLTYDIVVVPIYEYSQRGCRAPMIWQIRATVLVRPTMIASGLACVNRLQALDQVLPSLMVTRNNAPQSLPGCCINIQIFVLVNYIAKHPYFLVNLLKPAAIIGNAIFWLV